MFHSADACRAANLWDNPNGAQSSTGTVMTWGSRPSWVRRWESLVKLRIEDFLVEAFGGEVFDSGGE